MEKENHNMFGISELNCSTFFKPNWELNSMDQTDPFESALSSMVSSPTASSANGNANNGESIVLRELIGRLGSICNSGEISPHQHNPNFIGINGNNSANASCYSTPLNSPPKLNLENPNLKFPHQGIQFPSLPTLSPFSTDPGFAERAARFSSFASRNENGDSRENSSSVSEQIPVEIGNSRKRKSAPKGKGKEAPSKDANVVASENSESSAKRSKSEEEKDGEKQSSKDNSKPPEAPKDYIHVRARRGQATDAHSLAERVRREKISERMKVLQDLVPGCNKVTGKAVMLDEIINYVQSLQRQVEFLSMKLATVNPRMDHTMEALMSSKDMFQSRGSLRHNVYPSDSYSNMHNDTEAPFPSHNVNAALSRNQLPPMDNFSETASQVSSAFWEDDLHSIVQMGFGQNQTQNFQGILSTAQMKVEL